MRRNKVLQKFIGLGTYEGEDQNLSRPWVTFFTCLMMSSFITCTINIYFFFSNVKVVTELMFCCAIYIVIISSYWTILFNRSEARSFLIEIQETANKSMRFRRYFRFHNIKISLTGHKVRKDDFYERTEAYLEKITKLYFYLTLCTSILYGLVPFLIVSYDLYMDKYSLKSWSLHYNNVW